MKTKRTRSNKMSFRYLLFLPFLFFTFCEQDKEIVTISPANDQIITKDSKIVSMVLEYFNYQAINNKSDDDHDDDNDEQCLEFQYPIVFFAIIPTSQQIETIEITSDQEFFEFFNMLTDDDQIRLDFPIILFKLNGQPIELESMEELKELLRVAIDECCYGDDDDDNDNHNDDYPYCNDKETKVYICHNGHTICVSVNAIDAHMAHGDEMGECED